MPKNENNRRKFIRDLGLGSASLIGLPVISVAEKRLSPKDYQSKKTLKDSVQLGKDVEIELLYNGDYFLGLGSVQIEGLSLRDGSLPLSCEIRTPDGLQIMEMPVITKTITSNRIEIKMGARTNRIPLMEYMLHSVRNRENLYGWADKIKEEKNTFLTLTILPVNRTVGNQNFKGFSYQYHFESEDMRIYKILDHGSWEVNGQAKGNECWMRVGHVPSIVSFDNKLQRYSTENYFAGIANSNVFQFLPLQTELQGFTFTAHDQGILITWATGVEHIRTLLEKPSGQERIYHFHQHCNDLSSSFITSPVEVLWLAKKDSNRVERYNIYEDVSQMVHDRLHQISGIKPERVSTYGMIEQWNEPDFEFYTDTILPEFEKAGIKRLFLPNEFQNVMNTWGLSNMCCNVDFKFSETYGLEKLKRFCKRANQSGILIDMWGNTALSTLTEMFQWRDGSEKGIRFLPTKGTITEVLKNSSDPFVRNPSNAIEADHYTPRFAVMNLRDKDIRGYWMQQWEIAYQTGIHGIFLDSSFNMSSDKFHFIQNTQKNENSPGVSATDFYRPAQEPPSAILTQYHAHLQWVKQMQEMGISYCGEDLGVFGVHRHGPDLDMYINCMPLFSNSFMDFDEKIAMRFNRDPVHVYFKGLAYRIIWMLRWDFKEGRIDAGVNDERIFGFLKVFNLVEAYMVKRTILPDETAVLYDYERGEDKKMVYWIFEHTTIMLGKKYFIRNLTTGKEFYAATIVAEPMQVLIVSKAKPVI